MSQAGARATRQSTKDPKPAKQPPPKITAAEAAVKAQKARERADKAALKAEKAAEEAKREEEEGDIDSANTTSNTTPNTTTITNQARPVRPKRSATISQKMNSRQHELFPKWGPLMEDIYMRVLEYGLANKEMIQTAELTTLYPMAVVPDADYRGDEGRDRLVNDIEKWKKETQARAVDLHDMSLLVYDMINETVDKAQNYLETVIEDTKEETKNEVLAKLQPEIDELKRRLDANEAETKTLKSKLRLQNSVAKEIIVFNSKVTANDEDATKDLVKYLQPFYKSGTLKPDHITYVRSLKDTKEGDKRLSIQLASRTMQEEIVANSTHLKNGQNPIKAAVPPDIRAEKKVRFPYQMASAMYNYECKSKNLPFLSRVEKSKNKKVPYIVQKYANTAPEVSHTMDKWERNQIVKPKGYIEDQHQRYLPQ